MFVKMTESAQQIIDEIEAWDNEVKGIKSISADTLKHWAKVGVEPYFEDAKLNKHGGKNGI